ncbi:MAG TPA: hypothetical protein VGF47_05120 [Solirubrobacteraceae bacterium]
MSAATQPPPAPVAATTPVAVPPDLQSLEQKLLALQLSSERFSTTVSVAETPEVKGPVGPFKHIFGRASSVVTALLTASGEVSFAPVQASFQVSLFGITMNARLIGSTLYVEEPFVKRLDGGRIWVEERNKSLTQALGSQTSAPGSAVSQPGVEFQRVATLISRAQSIAELGPANVDGQAVTRFKLAVPLAALQQPGHSRQARAVARLQKKLFKPLIHVELLFAESGLPVRTSLTIEPRHHAGAVIEQSDITAVNVPVLVQAPPAGETITAAELHRLLRKRAKRMLRVISMHRHSHVPKKK